MQLGVSSRAAPDLALDALLEGCRRRGLAALELAAGDAHGVAPGMADEAIAAVRRRAAEVGVRIAGYRADGWPAAEADALARLAAALGAPLIVPIPQDVSAAGLEPLARHCAERGADLLLAHASDPAAATAAAQLAAALPGDVGLACELDPGRDGSAGALRAAGGRLRYLRLRGGGPEAARQEGQGVGALMARLALARYAGPLVLLPSTAQYRVAWGAWLGRRGGWGCGSKVADAALVSLDG